MSSLRDTSLARVRPVRAAGVTERLRGDELELVHSRDCSRLRLNRSARAVWSACDGRRSVRAIGDLIESELELPSGALLADVQATLATFAEHGFVRLEEEGAAEGAAETLRVFVGTDPRQRKAELALEESLRTNVTGPLEIVWMDAGRSEPWASWHRTTGVADGKKSGWGTAFTCFRYAVPELAGFRGRAIYMDSDVLVLRDLRELLALPMPAPWLHNPLCCGVALVDCAAFAEAAWWPRLVWMQSSGWGKEQYRALLERHAALGALPPAWDTPLTGKSAIERAAVLHFTELDVQPWMPWPERHAYKPHPNAAAVELWWTTYLAARRRSRVPVAREGVAAAAT